MSEYEDFVARVFRQLPSSPPSDFVFKHWSHAGRPTDEGFALMPIAGADPEKVLAARRPDQSLGRHRPSESAVDLHSLQVSFAPRPGTE